MNPKKPAEKRMRGTMIGVSFPPDRVAEVKAIADANGLTMSAWVRLAIFQRLDDLRNGKVDKMAV